jgi:hypothetical protein
MDRIVGADEEICPSGSKFRCGGQHQVGNAGKVVIVEADHIIGKRMSMHRHFGMPMRAQQSRALKADRSITKRGTLSRTGNDADMQTHVRLMLKAARAYIPLH